MLTINFRKCFTKLLIYFIKKLAVTSVLREVANDLTEISLKALSKIVTDGIMIFRYFSENKKDMAFHLTIQCQGIFSLKNTKKLKCSPASFVISTLMVNTNL